VSYYIAVETELYVMSCWSCHITYAVPKDFEQRRRKDKETFYCPRGHGTVFSGETEEQRLKQQLKDAEARAARLVDESERRRLKALQLERSRDAYKGQATRLRNRAAAGVCPCCKRSFAALARHMKTKHPDYTAQTEDA
jgi:hypothetical protein